MNRFTVEETNLLSIYHEGSKRITNRQAAERMRKRRALVTR